MLTIFAGLAQFERECLLEHQAEEIAIAKQQGLMGCSFIQPCARFRIHRERLAERLNYRSRGNEAGVDDQSDILSKGQDRAKDLNFIAYIAENGGVCYTVYILI